MKKANIMPVIEKDFPVLGPQSGDSRGQDTLRIQGDASAPWRDGDADDAGIVDDQGGGTMSGGDVLRSIPAKYGWRKSRSRWVSIRID
jgi:hypothetical protein